MNDAPTSDSQPNDVPDEVWTTMRQLPVPVPLSDPGLPPLNTDDFGLLTRLERQLGSSNTSVFTVANALAAIKRKGLARFYGLTFKEFCSQRLRLKKSRVHQLLEFADLLEETSALGPLAQPGNERQLRPLKLLPREERADAWAEAVETAPHGKLSARHVQAVVEAWLARRAVNLVKAPAPPPPTPSPKPVITPVPTPVAKNASPITPPTSGAAEYLPTVPGPGVAMPGWKDAWVKVARDPARPPASLRSGVFGWQPAE